MWPFKRKDEKPKYSKLDNVYCIVNFRDNLQIMSGRVTMINRFMTSCDDDKIYYKYYINPEYIHTFSPENISAYKIHDYFFISECKGDNINAILLHKKLSENHYESDMFASLNEAVKVFQYREVMRLRTILKNNLN